ncbi:acid-sensing ion channel 1 [Trichonephila clavata]|uniref:Acid-sensing ion channel 1 n=1 Tax=Trichonephila clavata TaxID=2740835 RepID=A0A8X6IL62_TRICU|nr:acid-sensing ion channel 1 [Trichonephila clavata]
MELTVSERQRETSFSESKLGRNHCLDRNVDKISSKLSNKLFASAFSQVAANPLSKIKFLRFLVLLVCFIGSIQKILSFCHLYWKYPVVVSLEVDQMQHAEFPSVSICNLNRMKMVNKECDERKKSESRKTKLPEEFKPEGKPIMISESRNLHHCRKIQSDINIRDRSEYIKLRFLMSYYRMNRQKRFEQGHNISDFIEECSFNGKSCSLHHSTYFTNLFFGNCFTFNKRVPNEELLQISKTGVGTGLNLKLNIESCYYLPTTYTMGVKVIIHHPNEIPNPEEEGLMLIPGYESLISLKQTVTRRLPNPFKDRCLDYSTQEKKFFGSRNNCLRGCIQKQNIAKCGCYDQSFSIMNNVSPCRILNESESCCLDDVSANMSQKMCNCPLPCSSFSYKEMLSRSVLSSKAYLSKDNETVSERASKEMSMKDILRVNVFYSSLERHEYKQQPKWRDTEVLSCIGNQLGLWLGLSIASIFDFIERIFFVIKTVIYKRFLSKH